jgi:hypothetical protein
MDKAIADDTPEEDPRWTHLLLAIHNKLQGAK